MSAALKQPLSSADRKLLVAWAQQWQRELPATHPAQHLLDAGVRFYSRPPFAVKAISESFDRLPENGAATLAWAAAGSALFAAAGAALPSTSWAVTLTVLGGLALTIAFARGDSA